MVHQRVRYCVAKFSCEVAGRCRRGGPPCLLVRGVTQECRHIRTDHLLEIPEKLQFHRPVPPRFLRHPCFVGTVREKVFLVGVTRIRSLQTSLDDRKERSDEGRVVRVHNMFVQFPDEPRGDIRPTVGAFSANDPVGNAPKRPASRTRILVPCQRPDDCPRTSVIARGEPNTGDRLCVPSRVNRTIPRHISDCKSVTSFNDEPIQ